MHKFQTADLCDEHADSLQICGIRFRSYGKKKQFYGKIETVKLLDDNVLLVEALENADEGSVIIVNNVGFNDCALLGDRLANIALSRNLSGIIINGYVRDSAELAQIDVGIFALGTYPLRSNKEGLGNRNTKLQFGNVEWRPGEFVYADEDGVVLSKNQLL